MTGIPERLLPLLLLPIAGLLTIRLLLALTAAALAKSRLGKPLAQLIKALLRLILYVLLGLILAEKLGIDTTGIVALASVLTLAISLSLQNALTNIIGGFTLLSTKPFQVGDFVELDRQTGTVLSVGLTYTRLATGDNKIIFLPNSTVTAGQIVNHTAAGFRRVDISLHFPWDAPQEQVLSALLDAARVESALVEKPPYAAISHFDEGNICYLLQLWCNAADYWPTLHAVNRRIPQCLAARDIPLPRPQLQLYQNPQ